MDVSRRDENIDKKTDCKFNRENREIADTPTASWIELEKSKKWSNFTDLPCSGKKTGKWVMSRMLMKIV